MTEKIPSPRTLVAIEHRNHKLYTCEIKPKIQTYTRLKQTPSPFIARFTLYDDRTPVQGGGTFKTETMAHINPIAVYRGRNSSRWVLETIVDEIAKRDNGIHMIGWLSDLYGVPLLLPEGFFDPRPGPRQDGIWIADLERARVNYIK